MRCLGSNTKSYSSLLVWAWIAFPNEPFLWLGSQGFRWLCAGSHGPAPGLVDIHLFYASSQRHAAGNQAAVRLRLQSGTWAAAAAAAAVVAAAWIHCPTPGKPEPGVRASPISHTQEAPGRRPRGSCTRVRWEGQGPPSLERDSSVRGEGCFLTPTCWAPTSMFWEGVHVTTWPLSKPGPGGCVIQTQPSMASPGS